MCKNYAWPITAQTKADYDAFCECMNTYNEQLKSKKIVIFGAGIRGTLISYFLKQNGFIEQVFTDNNEEKHGHYINEFPIVDFESLKEKKEDIFIIISVEEGYGIKRQLIDAGFMENENFTEIDSHVYDKYIQDFLEKMDTSIMIMGDCGMTDIALKDTCHASLSELLKNKLGKNKTKVLAIHGMGMRAYYEMAKAQFQYISKPEKLVVMANFETFTGKQHLLPRSQHVKLFKKLNLVLNDDSLKEHIKVIEDRFSNSNMDYFTSSKKVADNNDRNDRLVIKMNYMYHLKLNNECVQYIFRLHELCKEKNVKLYIFIPPVNYEYAQQLWGERFTERYEENVTILKHALEERLIPVLDLSYVLTSNKFADFCTIDECANYAGRRILAEALSDFVKQ